MMEVTLSRSWKEQFALAASMREEDVKYREKLALLDGRQRTMRADERIRTEKRDREFFEAVSAVLATERQIVDFRDKLDRYDEKTVDALMENHVALEEVQRRLDDHLGKAHVISDGRRVFKTQDGSRVFDETGLELNADVVDPNAIADWRPAFEQYKPDLDAKSWLVGERDALHAFQAKSDAAREEIDRGNVTAERLDALDAELKSAMPEAVRRKLGTDAPAQEAGITSEAGPVGLQKNDQRPAAFSPI